jgi:hypothetical protein
MTYSETTMRTVLSGDGDCRWILALGDRPVPPEEVVAGLIELAGEDFATVAAEVARDHDSGLRSDAAFPPGADDVVNMVLEGLIGSTSYEGARCAVRYLRELRRAAFVPLERHDAALTAALAVAAEETTADVVTAVVDRAPKGLWKVSLSFADGTAAAIVLDPTGTFGLLETSEAGGA